MRSPFISISIAALLFFISGSRALAAEIRGVVVDQEARPIPRVLVTATDAGGLELARTFTDIDGRFTLETDAAGGCFLEVRLIGFNPAQTDCGAAQPLRVVLAIAPLEEVILVSATRGDVPVGQTASSATIFTADDLDRRQRPFLADLLRTSAGTAVVGTGAPGGVTSLFVRGGESTHTKVLLDGIPLNEPGGTFDFSNVTTSHLARVEIVRGAHSALFGSDAVAGVVQMFTARGRPGEPRLAVTFEGGSFGTVREGITFGTAGARWDGSVHASRIDTNNAGSNHDFGNTTFAGAAGARLGATASLRFVGRSEIGRAGTPGQTAFGRPDLDAFYERHSSVAGIALEQRASASLHHKASYAYSAVNQTSTNLEADPPYTPAFDGRTAAFEFFDFVYDNQTRLRRHHASYQLDWRLTRRVGGAGEHLLTLASEWDGERATLLDRATPRATRAARDNFGWTLQHQVLWPRVFVTTGLRLDGNDSFGFAASPRASIAVIVRESDGLLGPTKLKAAAGRGIKEPTILQSFSPSPFFLGNPDLEPERSRTVDAGIEQGIGGRAATIDVTWFDNRFRDLISTRTLSFNPFRSQYFNIGLTRARGVEIAGAVARFAPIRARAGYTYLASSIVRSVSPSNTVFAEGQWLFRRPRHSGFLDVEGGFGPASVTLIGTFIGRTVDSDFSSLDPPMIVNDAHARWDARGKYAITRRLAATWAIDNLFDRKYMEPLGYPVLGRAARVGVHVGF